MITFAEFARKSANSAKSRNSCTVHQCCDQSVSALGKDPLFGGDFDFIKTLKQKGLVVLDCRFLSLKQTRLIAAAAARTLQRYGRDMAQAAEHDRARTHMLGTGLPYLWSTKHMLWCPTPRMS